MIIVFRINIVLSTISLVTPSGNIVSVDSSAPVTVGDYDGDGISDLMVKFDRATVVRYLGATDALYDGTGIDYQAELKIKGNLLDETSFEGTDTIRVIKTGSFSKLCYTPPPYHSCNLCSVAMYL